MLILKLELKDQQVNVRANGKESHHFSLAELRQSKEEWKDFLNNPRIYGEKLFNTLFKNAARMEFDALSKQAERTIVLVLESSELDSVAWEYAYYDNAYIVEDFAFIRALPEKERPHSNGRLSKSVERVPLLFIPANPLVDLSGEPMRELDIEKEWHEMTQHIVKSNAPFDLIELRPATPAALQSVMARFRDGMIAHFSGHGAATKDGALLLFENENGSSNPLEAREFVREVKDQAWIGFLSACQSAVAERTEYSNLARELVKAGVPFALGMQFNLPDPFAPNISGQFYNYLSQGHAVPEAARQARRAVKRENEFYVGMIALYAVHPDETGKMGWSGSGARTLSTFAAADVSDLPTPSGFIGRQRELMNIGTSLLGKKKPNTVTLHGAGGIGKTALMRQALLRFAPSFESALAIALDPLPSLESVLGRLERFLNLPSPCSNDSKERERIVRERLASKRTLLGLDNFETLNYALNEKGSDEEKTAKSLHSFFKYLAANGVTLCATSREVTNLGGETIEDIQGLTNKNGGRLFQENVVKQKNEIYIEQTQQVSEMVGGHPLALRLLASAFDDQVGTSLDQYIEDLQSHLPKARDKWTEEDRHESLRASFDFTMNSLLKTSDGKKLQVALSRLSVFRAFFFDQTAAPVLENRFPESEEEFFEQMIPYTNVILHSLWERGLLERTTIQSVEEDFYLYRLHPVLRFFAKAKIAEADTNAMRENYWYSMKNLARGAEIQRNNNPLMMQIALRGMPDLVNASKIKENHDAALMGFRVSKLLIQFGFYDDALDQLSRLSGIAEGLGDLKIESSALHEKANIYAIRGDLDEAMKLYQQSLDIKEGLGDLKGKLTTISEMARIFAIRGGLEKAIEMQEQIIAIANNLGDQREKTIAMHNLADIYITQGDLESAINLYQQNREIFEGLKDLKGKSATLHQMATIYARRGNLDEALQLYQQVFEIAEGMGNLKDKSSAIYGIANIYDRRGNLDESLQLYKQVLEIDEELGNLKGKASTLHAIANIYITRGKLDEAILLSKQSLEIKEALGNLEGKSASLHQLANIYATRGDLEMAVKLSKQSLEIDNQLGNLEGKAAGLTNIGLLSFQRHQYLESLELLLSALEIRIQLREKSKIEELAYVLNQFKQVVGIEEFRKLWRETTGSEKLPEWLS